MDLELSTEQSELRRSLEILFRRHAQWSEELQPFMRPAVLDELERSGFLDLAQHAGALEATFVLEIGARFAALAPIAGRALVGPLSGLLDLPPAIGLSESANRGLVRYGANCDAFLVLEADEMLFALAADCDIEPVASRYGYPLARVSVRRGERLGSAAAARLRTAWRLAIAVEAAAYMLAAIDQTARYVASRRQFGRPIGSFQAVQHRLATAYVMASGSHWLARRAAWCPHDGYLAAAAASYATTAAATTYTNVHQVSGGMGISSDFGLVRWTTRLLSLQRDLGGARAHARAVAAERSTSPCATRAPALRGPLGDRA